MRFGIVVSDPSDWTARALKEGFEKLGAKAIFLNFSGLAASIDEDIRLHSNGAELADLDGLVIRDLGRSGAHDVAFRFETLCALENLDIPIVNSPAAIQKAANKFATSIALSAAGIPNPRTLVSTDLGCAYDFIKEHGRAVSKPLFGYKGRDLALLGVDDLSDLEHVMKHQGVVYLQEFHKSPRDIRVFVVGDEVAGAIYRFAPPGSWISNLSRGGRPEICSINDEIAELAIGAKNSVGAVYCGVDLLETDQGLKVLEVNGTPSGKGINDACGINVGDMIARHVLGIAR
jgi:tetrahydromethanopterin:alpha-L-glutamate ligase